MSTQDWHQVGIHPSGSFGVFGGVCALAKLRDLVEEVTDSRPEPEALAELGAYGMAATLDIALPAKQTLLELRSERARLEQLEALFAEALKRIRTAARVGARRGTGP